MRLVQVISDYIRRSLLTTQGDLVVRGATGPVRLQAGTAGYFLRSQGPGSDLIWVPVAVGTLPACRVWLSANQSMPSTAWTKVEVDTVEFDTTGDWDAGNLRYVASEAGYYIACLGLYYVNIPNAKEVQGIVKITGAYHSPYSRLSSGAVADYLITLNDIIHLDVNDWVEIWGFHTSGANRDVKGAGIYRTWMSLHKLS